MEGLAMGTVEAMEGLVLLAFKVLHPKHVHLNRGNHEDVMLNQAYGFADEV